MLQLGKVRAGEYHMDLGSGDGRIAVTSAAKYGARSFGVDLNPVRIEEARDNAKKANVSDRATFEVKNLFETDIGKADIVTMYLLPSVNLDLRPKVLSDMWPGTRIVSHAFDMGDWTADHGERHRPHGLSLDRAGARAGALDHRRLAQVHGHIQQTYQKIAGTAEIGGKSVPLRDASLTAPRSASRSTSTGCPIASRASSTATASTAGATSGGRRKPNSGPCGGMAARPPSE